jgi:hypothetical protein
MQINPQTATLQDWFDAVAAETDPRIKEEKRFFLHARTAINSSMTNGECLLGLMVWIGLTLPSGEKHTRLVKPFDILRSGEAWCDQHVKVFLFFIHHLFDLPGREVALYHTDGVNGHTVAEVYCDASWHLFDVHPDHCYCYRNHAADAPMSYEEINYGVVATKAKGLTGSVVEDEHHWWRGENGVGKEGFYRLEDQQPPVFDESTVQKHFDLDW